MKKYEQIDISGDVGLKIWGDTFENLFINAAGGMGELITDAARMKPSERMNVFLNADSIEDLLVKWLNELIFLFDTRGFVGKTFHIDISTTQYKGQGSGGQEGIKLVAEISGGIFSQEVNESRLLIKAATYHNLSVKKTDSYWEATVIFDI